MATRSKKYSFGSLFQFTPLAVEEVRQNFRKHFLDQKCSGNPPLISYDRHSYTFSFELAGEETQSKELFTKLLKGYIDRQKSEPDLLEGQRLIPLPGTAVDDPCSWEDLFPLEDAGSLVPLDEDDGPAKQAKATAGYRPEIWKPSTVSAASLSSELIDALQQQTGCILDPNSQTNEVYIHGGNVPQALTILRELEPLMTLARNPANSHAMSLAILTEESRIDFARLSETSLTRIILDPDLNSVDAWIFKQNSEILNYYHKGQKADQAFTPSHNLLSVRPCSGGNELCTQWQGHRHSGLGHAEDAAHRGAGAESENGEKLDPLPASHFLSTNDSKVIEKWAGNVVEGEKVLEDGPDPIATEEAQPVVGRTRRVREDDSDDSDDSDETERGHKSVVAPQHPPSKPDSEVRSLLKTDIVEEAPATAGRVRKVKDDSESSDEADRQVQSSVPVPMRQHNKYPPSTAYSQRSFEPYKDSVSEVRSETTNNWANPYTRILADPPHKTASRSRRSRVVKDDSSDDDDDFGPKIAPSVISSAPSMSSRRGGRGRGRGRGFGSGLQQSGRTRVVKEDSSDSENDPRTANANAVDLAWGESVPEADVPWGETIPHTDLAVTQSLPPSRNGGKNSAHAPKSNGNPPLKLKTVEDKTNRGYDWGTTSPLSKNGPSPVVDVADHTIASEIAPLDHEKQSASLVDAGFDDSSLQGETGKRKDRGKEWNRNNHEAEDSKNTSSSSPPPTKAHGGRSDAVSNRSRKFKPKTQVTQPFPGSSGNRAQKTSTSISHPNKFGALEDDQLSHPSQAQNDSHQPRQEEGGSGQDTVAEDVYHVDSDKVSALVSITPASSQLHQVGAPPPGYELFAYNRLQHNRSAGSKDSKANQIPAESRSHQDSGELYVADRRGNVDIGILTKQEVLKIERMRRQHESKHGQPPGSAAAEAVQQVDEASTRVFHKVMNQQARKKPARKQMDASKAEAMQKAWGPAEPQANDLSADEAQVDPQSSNTPVNPADRMESGKTENSGLSGVSTAKKRIMYSRKDALNERLTIDLKRQLTNRVVTDLLPVFHAAIPFPGELRFEIRFGQFLSPEPQGLYQAKTVDIAAWQRLYEKNRGPLASASAFTNILTRNGADADHFLGIKTPRNGPNLFEETKDDCRKIRFEFHCRGKKNDDFIIAMDSDGTHHIERPFQKLGCVHIRCPDQIWDAAAVVSSSWRLPEAPEAVQAAEALIKSVYIPTGKTEIEISYRVPQLEEFAVKRVVMRRSTRHRCTAENKDDVELEITEVQRLFVELRQNGVYLAYATKYDSMAKRSMIHYEASLHSATIETAFAENKTLKLGEKAKTWTAEQLLEKDRIRHLLETMQMVVAKIDGVGYHNVGSALFFVNEQRERTGAATADQATQLAVPDAPINVPGVRGGPAQHVIGNYALGYGGARVPRPELVEPEGLLPGDSASQAAKPVPQTVEKDAVGFW